MPPESGLASTTLTIRIADYEPKLLREVLIFSRQTAQFSRGLRIRKNLRGS